jgi:TRAP-type C4-dicarboxylate transport system substrate-binding protein
MTMTRVIAAAALAGAALLVGPADAQSPVIVKIATIAPDGSPWHDVLVELAQRWRDVSHGGVQVKIYAGGTQGDESGGWCARSNRPAPGRCRHVHRPRHDLARLQRLLVPARVGDELDYVRDRISPRLTRSLSDHGFVVLNWGDGGWVRFFTTRPARTIDDTEDADVHVGRQSAGERSETGRVHRPARADRHPHRSRPA